MYIIIDCFNNALQYNGKFNFSAYGSDFGVPMEFNDIEDAYDYISIIDPNNSEDLIVEKLNLKGEK